MKRPPYINVIPLPGRYFRWFESDRRWHEWRECLVCDSPKDGLGWGVKGCDCAGAGWLWVLALGVVGFENDDWIDYEEDHDDG